MAKITTLFATLMAAVLISSVSCSRKGKGGQPGGEGSVPVTPFVVHEKNVAYYNTYPATVAAPLEVDLKSEVSGYVTGMFFKEGSLVKKGSKLYEIDRSKYLAVYNQADAAVEMARANLMKAKRDMERYRKLAEQDAIAEQTLEDARTNLENTSNQVKAAEAGLTRAKTDLDYSVIKAPFTGLIGFSQVKPGAFVTGGQTYLNTLSSVNPAAVDFNVDSKELEYYRELEKGNNDVSDSTFLLLLQNGKTYPDAGKLSVIDRAVDPLTGTVRIRLLFPNDTQLLKTGMDVRVKVLNQSSGKQLIIPHKAVIEQMSEYFVYLIHGQTVQQKRIEPGLDLQGTIVVNSGIEDGDTIVAEGVLKLRNGSQISIAPQGQPENGKQ